MSVTNIFTANTRAKAAEVNQNFQDITSNTPGKLDWTWTSYTPTWQGSVTAPVLGNGTLVARYIKIAKTLMVRIYIQMGSTTTYGSGTWSFTLPAGENTPAFVEQIGSANALDSSTGNKYVGASRLAVSNNDIFADFHGTTLTARDTVPFTWATNDQLWLAIDCEVA